MVENHNVDKFIGGGKITLIIYSKYLFFKKINVNFVVEKSVGLNEIQFF